MTTNPVKLIRQKSKFIRKEAAQRVVRRLSNKQWQIVMDLTKERASEDLKEERRMNGFYFLLLI